MKTKLTLSVDKDLVRIARDQASKEGTSVSALFSKFIVNRKLKADQDNLASVSNMVGSLKAYAVDDSKQAIRSMYAGKHLN